MRKGITPIIAMILLILIVVALGGVFAAWVTRTQATMTTSAGEQITTGAERMQKTIMIESLDCTGNNIYVRNTGASTILAAEYSVYYNDGLSAATTTDITAGGLAEISIAGDTPSSNDVYKVTSVGGSASVDTCP